MAELADAPDLGSGVFDVGVQVPSAAPKSTRLERVLSILIICIIRGCDMKYSTVIFDLDGTILNSLDDLYSSVNFALNKNSFPLRSKEEVRSFVGNGARKLVERAVPAGLDADIIQRVFDDFITHYRDNCTNETAPYDGICDLLKELKDLGVKTAVVSNKADFAVRQLCDRYFPNLLDISLGEKEGIKTKPDPAAVLEVMRKLGATHDSAVYVGDSEVDIETAVNASLPCISVDWGFKTKEFLASHNAEIIVSTVEELKKKLLS